MSEETPTGNLTLMFCVADAARADIALTSDRIYYRFATDESIEDGELPGIKEGFDKFVSQIIADISAREGETPLADEIKVSVFLSNRATAFDLSEESLRRIVNSLKAIADEFGFLNGFC